MAAIRPAFPRSSLLHVSHKAECVNMGPPSGSSAQKRPRSNPVLYPLQSSRSAGRPGSISGKSSAIRPGPETPWPPRHAARRRRYRLESRHALGQQAEHHATQNVAGAGGRQPGAAGGVDRGLAVRSGDHRIGAFQHDGGAAAGRGRAAPGRPSRRRARRRTAAQTRPSCGVITTGAARASMASNSASGSRRKRSARRRRAPRPASAFKRRRAPSPCVASPTPWPGPIRNAFLRVSARSAASPLGVVGLAHHDGGELRGVDGKRVARRGDSDEPGAGPQCAPRGQAAPRLCCRRARHHDRVPARYLWPSSVGQGTRASHSAGSLTKVLGVDLSRAR